MPLSAPKPCLIPRCPGLATRGRYCGQHARIAPPLRKARDDRRGSSAARGYDGEWRKFRAWVLSMHPGCNRCPAKATEIHHIIALEDGGARLDINNTEPLCARCHTDAEAKRWRAGHRRPRRGMG